MLRSGSICARAAVTAAGLCAVVALALPAGASAVAVSGVPTINTDVGQFSLPIACAISLPTAGGLTVFNLDTNVVVAGAVAATLAPGQQFSLSEGSGSITFPSWLATLSPLITVTQASVAIPTLDIGAENATPSDINLASTTSLAIPDLKLTPGKSFTVGLPLTGTFTVGPYTAPNSGTVTLQFNGAVADVNLESAAGKVVLPLVANCKATAGNALLTIAVGGAAGAAPSLLQGEPVAFPTTTANGLDGVINAGYSCTIEGTPVPVGIAVGATNIPLSVKKGGSLSFTGASGALDVPASSVNMLLAKGIKTISGSVTSVDLDATGATPAVDNATAGGIPIPLTTLVANQAIVIPLPSTGTLTAGPFTPPSASTNILIGLGTASANLDINGSIIPSAVSCGAPSPQVILVNDPVT